MTGFILAAGLGTRLLPLTSHIPKALVPLCGIPLFEHACCFLKSAGITRFGANVHYLADQLIDFGKKLDCSPYMFNETGRIRGTGGALFFAKDFLLKDDVFCVVNADIVTNVNLSEIITDFKSSNCIAGLVAAEPLGKGTIWYNPATEKYAGIPAELPHYENLAPADFIGISIYRREFLEILNEDDFSITPVWKRAIQNNFGIKVYVKSGIYWNDLGTPAMLAKAHFDVLDNKLQVKTADGMKIDYKNSRAYPESMSTSSVKSIEKYVWCQTAEVDASAKIEHSVIFDKCRIDGSVNISNAIITPWEEISFA